MTSLRPNPELDRDRSGSSTLSASINRFASPDHAVGRTLMAWRVRLQLLTWMPTSADERALRSVIAALAPAYTMVDVYRLRRLAHHGETVHGDRIAGAVVECGTWRGGSLALIDWVFRRRGDVRPLYAFDSFEGLPPPTERDPPAARSGFFRGWCTATEEDVRSALDLAGGTSELHVVPGWLADTLPRVNTGPIALLNVDVDWYDSVRTVLCELFDRVAPGGIINFDDYRRWRGCDDAVHEFLQERGLSRALIQTAGGQGGWLRKP